MAKIILVRWQLTHQSGQWLKRKADQSQKIGAISGKFKWSNMYFMGTNLTEIVGKLMGLKHSDVN